ncbi:MAG: HAMP domain-containing histidine kinase [Ktedonobacteraceae bacterium]|nr:HAMP domain-containing histidine kinase [Ktedonobacteraceae bacterium]
MSAELISHAPQSNQGGDPPATGRPTRLYASVMGYFFSLLLVAVLSLLEKIDQTFPHAPIFLGAPFGMISILIALLWGSGPALFSMVLGVIVIVVFLSPGIVTPDMMRDIIIIGPFVLLQLLALAIVVRMEKGRRRLLTAQQTAQTYAQELEAANAELHRVNSQLEQANYLKDYVLTRSSHELKTPLTTILGRTQLLLARLERFGETPENCATVHKHLEVIEERAHHLRSLIENLLDLSKIYADEEPFHLVPCDLGSLCHDVVEEAHTRSGRTIELEIPAGPLPLRADDKRLSQVLTNLLSNAIKYSPEHTPIHVRVDVENGSAVLSVHNECPALSQEQLEHIFEPFYRTVDVEYSSIPGWGLGLAMSKKIVERHSGRIWVESSADNGITFSVRLPFTTTGPLNR